MKKARKTATHFADNADDIAACAELLERLAKEPARFFEKPTGLDPIRAAANRLVEAVKAESEVRRNARSAAVSQVTRTRRKERDANLVARTGMRQMRQDTVPLLPAAELPIPPPPSELLEKARHCYVCKQPFRELHAYYDSLCPSCAALNAAKRTQSADLNGRTVLLTGGRIKIGFEATLKLLRAGASVIMTTRFPCDAARRFSQAPDASDWAGRLTIHGIDLRDLRAVERFSDTIASELDRLDVIINNAAQTVRRPPDFYRHLLAAETRGPAALPAEARRFVVDRSYHEAEAPVLASALSQIPLLPEDLAPHPEAFPLAVYDRNGQQRDLREVNSWRLQVGQIETNEILETHYVNAIAPFVLVNRLLAVMDRTPGRRFIVNVSAMEGKFEYRKKQSTHPHTNMAKASLNMLTRTAAATLARRGIYMNSVDTGWVTNENPYSLTERMRENLGFEPPLDEIDGAARVLDPIFAAGETPPFGLFLKDYRPAGW
jgi:NAD(P)-dependent dehydrogenase (short-subunit alcohol dehydrogenase family)